MSRTRARPADCSADMIRVLESGSESIWSSANEPEEQDGIGTLVIDFGDYEAMAQFGRMNYGYGGARAGGTERKSGRVLNGQTGPEEFVVAGFDATVSFRRRYGSAAPRADFVSAEQGAFEDGRWKPRRQLSGDEIFFGLRIPAAGAVVEVKLMKY